MWVLIGLVVAALLLAVPLDLSFRFDSRPEGHRAARLRWGFGLIRMRLGRGRKRREPAASVRRMPRASRRARAALFTPGLGPAVFRRVRGIIRSIHIRTFDLRADLGTGDPADTGVLFGALSGALAAVPAARHTVVAIVPDFDRSRSDVRLRGDVRVVPGLVVGHALALVLSPTGFRTLVRMARA